jgi:hypothetical protein
MCRVLGGDSALSPSLDIRNWQKMSKYPYGVCLKPKIAYPAVQFSLANERSLF